MLNSSPFYSPHTKSLKLFLLRASKVARKFFTSPEYVYISNKVISFISIPPFIFIYMSIYIKKKVIYTACSLDYSQLKIIHFLLFDDFFIHFHNYVIILGFEKLRMPAINSHPESKVYSLIQVLQFKKFKLREVS